MIVIGAIDLCAALFLFMKSFRWKAKEPHNAKYFSALRVLGLIFVAVAFYRCVFVSSYANRLVWLDTLFNSPFIVRCLACCAEMSFIGMIAVIFGRMRGELSLRGAKHPAFLRIAPLLAVACIFLAQFFAFGGLITQSLTLFAIEETLWVVAFLCLVPLIFFHLKQKPAEKSYRVFLIIMTIWCAGYLSFQCFFTLPFVHYANLAQDIGRTIPPDALRMAIFNYIPTRNYHAWGGIGFFIWHSGYFSICAWMALFFMTAPRMRRTV